MALFLSGSAVTVGAEGARIHRLSRAEYLDKVHAVWSGQIVATILAWPHEHQVASVQWLTNFSRAYKGAPVDDDWYYEICALRAFEKYGTGLTVAQLGQQWMENNCGSWGSSEQARINLARGILPPDTGHPRYNKLWFTIGPQFSADIYGALSPGLVTVAGEMARQYGHINGYAEGTDGAVFMASMVSLGFVEDDTRQIVRRAARMIDPRSPYRKCLDLVMELADSNHSFQSIATAVEDRWHIEYPASNNAVPNGGITAAALWFGEGDFLKTVNLIAGAADFTDADCNAANAAAVIGAIRGMKGIPAYLVSQLGDRITGDRMGSVQLTPSVDESISGLASRTAAMGERLLLTHGVEQEGETLVIPVSEPVTQPAELFTLGELMRYWNAEWTLERAGFGGAGGGIGGIRGLTHLDGEILATWPRDEVRGVVLRRRTTPGPGAVLQFEAGADAGRAWELNVYVNNRLLEKQLIEGTSTRQWQVVRVDLSEFAGQPVELRLYQRVLVTPRVAGNALWRGLTLN